MMKSSKNVPLLLLLLLPMSCTSPQPSGLAYPETRKDSTVDNYHGTMVADPYRWLEDDNSDETKAWVQAQNAVSYPYLEGLSGRAEIQDRLTKLWNYPRFGNTTKKGGRYLYTYNDGLQNQSVLYVMDALDQEPRVLIDPNTLSDDGTVAMGGWSVSDNGRYIQYAISRSGSDWTEFFVRDIETGEDLSDHLKHIKFSGGAWTQDSRGFFYQRYPEPEAGQELSGQNRNPMLMFHTVGTDQSQDQLVYERPDQPDWGFGPSVTHDGRFLVINIWQGTDPRSRVYVKDLSRPNSEIRPFLDAFDASYSIIGNDGDVFYVVTNKDAPKYKLVAIQLSNPSSSQWKTMIPESDETLQWVRMLNNQFVASYLKDAYSKIRVFTLEGNVRGELSLPGIGTAGGFTGSRYDTETFYSFTSFNYPSTVFRYDFATEQSTVYRQPEVAFNPSEYIVEQHFYNSKDGTQVPMFIAYKQGLVKNGKNPTYLYGYGGFNVSLTPYFSVSELALMDMGGVFAMPNLRGGGEYGEQWHLAGTKERKQNVFDDFIAAAEFLIASGYTSPEHLAIGGGSNGGLLVAATMLQRPELFAAAIPAVGVLDMLRYHKFTIGWAWASDYGTSEDPEGFEYLMKYSPLHNVKEGVEYPATLITTADHDDRVVPAHSFKFAAELQSTYKGDRPMIIRIESNAGHGAGKPTAMVIAEETDVLSFMAKHIGLDVSRIPRGAQVVN
jgi:prolyl oligopeptidase